MLKTLFGQFNWEPPAWAQTFGLSRLRWAAAFLVLVALVFAANRFLISKLPGENEILASTSAPELAQWQGDKLQPQALIVKFSWANPSSDRAGEQSSFARLELIEKILTEAPKLEPARTGEWRFTDANTLEFKPTEPWPADQEFSVRLSNSWFQAGLKLSDPELTFTTRPFSVAIENFRFHQNPGRKDDKALRATLRFSHPVDRQSLSSHLTLEMKGDRQGTTSPPVIVASKLEYGEADRLAHVVSESLQLPDVENRADLILRSKLRSATGPATLDDKVEASTIVPDIGSYFHVDSIASQIARDDNDRPRQALTLSFTDRVSANHLRQSMEVFLLPKFKQPGQTRNYPDYWQEPGEVTPDILTRAKQINLQLDPVPDLAASLHSAALDLPAGRFLFIRINKGLKSETGYESAREHLSVVRIPDYPKEVSIGRDGAILALSGDHKLSFVSRGLRALKIDIGVMAPENIANLASQTYGDIDRPSFPNYRFNKDNLTERYSQTIALSQRHPAEAQYTHIDLSEQLPRSGFFFVEVQGWDPVNKRPTGASDSRFIAISDLGIFVKSANDGAQDIFVHSIANGQPLAGAKVQLISKNASVAMSALTGTRGHARLASPDKLRREKEPVAWLVSYNGDQMFLPFRRSERMLRYSRFDVGGEYAHGSEHEQSLKAQLFTDRGLYRPGESVHIGAIVKRNDWKGLPELPLKLQIRDPRGQIVQTRSLQVSKSGLFDSLFVSDAAYPTGTYQLSLQLSDRRRGSRQIGQASFRLEEFQPDSMRIRTEFVSQKNPLWLQPSDIQFAVQLDTLYGSPASDRTVKADLDLKLSQLRVPAFPDYRFSIPLPEQSASQQLPAPALPEQQTDSSGQAHFQFSLNDLGDGFYRLTASAEGFELTGGRSVKSENAIAISSNHRMLGVKADGDLSFVHKDSDRSVSLIAVDSVGNQQPIDQYSVRVAEELFVSSLIQNDDGSFAYQSVRKYQQISEAELAKADGAQTLALDTSKPGTYRVRIIDEAGKAQAEFTYSVAGARNLSANLERDAELTLAIDGEEFRPGETIAINITAPYSGAGLITIERDRVLAHRWFKASQTSSVQHITLPDDIEGNAYVNVSLVRDLDSDEVFINPLSYAVSPIKITPGTRKLEFTLDSTEQVRPGQTLEVTATASRPAKAIVYAVDAGILQAANYKPPNPLEFFLPKMALQVDTYQLADLILPRHANLTRRAAPGGGEGRALLGQNLNPFRRKAEAHVVYWSGVVDLDTSGTRVAISVPDYFNGELKIFAVAVDQNGVGAQTTRSLAKAPIVIQPNVLPAVTPGDEFFASAMIGNELGRDANIRVRLELPETLSSEVELSQDLQLAAGAQSSVEFAVKAGTTLGASELRFVASSGDLNQGRTTSMSIRPAVNFAQTLVSGQSSKTKIDVDVPRRLRPQFAEQSLVASSSPLILTEGLKNYLAGFPHACTEQMVSKVFPQLGLLQAQLSSPDRGALVNEVAATIGKLRTRQRSDGGFSFWPGADASHDLASVYLLHFLTEAREFGIDVPNEVFEQGVGYLRELAANRQRGEFKPQLRAYAIYVLTRQEFVSTNYLTDLHDSLKDGPDPDWRSTLTASYMAASYKQLKLNDAAQELIRDFSPSPNKNTRSDFDTELSHNSQHIYLLAKHFPERLEQLPPNWVDQLSVPIASNQFNSFSASFATLALAAYSQAVADSNSGLPLISLDDQSGTAFIRADLPLSQTQASIRNESRAQIFHSLSQSGYDQTRPATARSRGLEISREFVNDKGEAIDTVGLGDELTVRIRLRSDGPTRTNLALVALLPGGFEIDRNSARKQAGNANVDYVDLREDRAVYYLSATRKDSLIEFRIKAIAKGQFDTGQVHLASMYDLTLEAYTAPGEITVSP